MAIRTGDPVAVIEALGLRDVERIDWARGVERGYATDVFVTPPVDGWVLAMSSAPEFIPDEVLDSGQGLATRLSTELDTEVQHFRTYRVIDAHVWVKAERGALVRAYSVDEEGVVDVGERTPEEVALGDFYDPRCDEAASDDYWERTDLRSVSEADVFAVSAAWSVDPTRFEEWEGEMADGWVGGLASP